MRISPSPALRLPDHLYVDPTPLLGAGVFAPQVGVDVLPRRPRRPLAEVIDQGVDRRRVGVHAGAAGEGEVGHVGPQSIRAFRNKWHIALQNGTGDIQRCFAGRVFEEFSSLLANDFIRGT